MPDEMVTLTVQVPRRDAARLVSIVGRWVGDTALSDRAYERWRATEHALDDAVVEALRQAATSTPRQGGGE